MLKSIKGDVIVYEREKAPNGQKIISAHVYFKRNDNIVPSALSLKSIETTWEVGEQKIENFILNAYPERFEKV